MTDRESWDLIAGRYAQAFGDRLFGVAAFGSRARGTARPDSDHDILLVVSGLTGDVFERARLIRRPLAGLNAANVQVLARAPEEFDADVTPLHLDLALDALVLFERDGFLRRRLGRLRDLITEAGLERGQDLAWAWRRPPRTRDWAITWEGVRV